jgi:hypothetical protein
MAACEDERGDSNEQGYSRLVTGQNAYDLDLAKQDFTPL